MQNAAIKWVCRGAILGLVGLPWAAQADPLSAVQLLREGGCGGLVPAARPLHHEPSLDRAAELWSRGMTSETAVEHSGYPAQATAAVHVNGADAAMVPLLRKNRCNSMSNPDLRDIGIYRHGTETWLLMARPYSAPSRAQAPVLATRALQLVNDVRARGARCGQRSFGPAPPVKLSETLGGVAFGHATDMAVHNYFEHEDRGGHTPADRVRAAGYAEKLVGENIAYGPQSAEEVVQGWLDSPGHCENIMDPRFSEMGIAFAPGKVQRHGLYWVQLLVAPKV